MTSTALGTIVGLVLGLTLAFGTFGQMLVVALFGLIGFVVSKVAAGQLDLTPYLTGRAKQ